MWEVSLLFEAGCCVFLFLYRILQLSLTIYLLILLVLKWRFPLLLWYGSRNRRKLLFDTEIKHFYILIGFLILQRVFLIGLQNSLTVTFEQLGVIDKIILILVNGDWIALASLKLNFWPIFIFNLTFFDEIFVWWFAKVRFWIQSIKFHNFTWNNILKLDMLFIVLNTCLRCLLLMFGLSLLYLHQNWKLLIDTKAFIWLRNTSSLNSLLFVALVGPFMRLCLIVLKQLMQGRILKIVLNYCLIHWRLSLAHIIKTNRFLLYSWCCRSWLDKRALKVLVHLTRDPVLHILLFIS